MANGIKVDPYGKGCLNGLILLVSFHLVTKCHGEVKYFRKFAKNFAKISGLRAKQLAKIWLEIQTTKLLIRECVTGSKTSKVTQFHSIHSSWVIFQIIENKIYVGAVVEWVWTMGRWVSKHFENWKYFSTYFSTSYLFLANFWM